ncbi:MAG: hypothetical protein VYA91_14780 [Pseudomonadota bacterium]|nr:hypothetical protein [Pseudomonadota bacterium]
MVATDVGEIVGVRVEDLPLAAAFLLGLVHGHVGMHDQLLFGPAMVRNQGCADADGVLDHPVLALQRDLSVQLLGQFLQEAFELLGVDVHQHHGEFVARQSADGVAATDTGTQGPGDLDQHTVADRVAVDIVDLLEAVDVNEDDGARPARIQDFLEIVLKTAAVADAGQWIVVGQPLQGFFVPLALGQINADGQENVPTLFILHDRASPVDVDRVALMIGELRVQLDHLALLGFQALNPALEGLAAVFGHEQVAESADGALELVFKAGVAGQDGAIHALGGNEQVGAVDQALQERPGPGDHGNLLAQGLVLVLHLNVQRFQFTGHIPGAFLQQGQLILQQAGLAWQAFPGKAVLMLGQQFQGVDHGKQAPQRVEHDQDQDQFGHQQRQGTDQHTDLDRIDQVLVLLGLVADGHQNGRLTVGEVFRRDERVQVQPLRLKLRRVRGVQAVERGR